MGKKVSSGPVKPNEPIKKGDAKKSFLSNAGKALQSTPARRVFTPRPVNVGSLIYNDAEPEDKGLCAEELQFTKPTYNYSEYLLDHLKVFIFIYKIASWLIPLCYVIPFLLYISAFPYPLLKIGLDTSVKVSLDQTYKTIEKKSVW